jgi:hypothetical protein
VTSFTITLDGERITVRLHSLAEYEADGGVYSDAGNGGEDVSSERDRFLAALSVEDVKGHDMDDVLNAAGVDLYSTWFDSSTGYVLLEEFPTEAPLAARLVQATSER